MTQIAEQLKQQLIRLSAQDRAELAQFLIGSLEQDEDPDAEEVWSRELDKRTEEIESGRVVGKPAEEVFARLRERYG